eukprot:TRINITY_DN4322_c0_g2_i2.p1 TRINITY_DN4322_c0_g2~~TRINITY_DN4322_c0_g2_i2.p1  ORF type:complete len:130 (+),score=34.42 TRINITY_DN4322_c0_g2_i2:56-445(+)
MSAEIKDHCNSSSPHANWIILTGDLKVKAKGNGISQLVNTLQDNEVNFCLLTLRLELQGIPDQARNIFIHWKGPSASAMTKVKTSQKYQEALNLLSPNHGQLEAIGKSEFNEPTIVKRWGPGTGSHVLN